MFKRKCALLITSMMLAVAAPAASPALSAQAASYVQTREAVSSTLTTSGKFVKRNGFTYYLASDGSEKTGWIYEKGHWYYFSKKDGRMVTGWLMYGKNKYFLRKNGMMIEGPGWVTLAGKRYYFTKDGNVRAAWELSGGKWYYRDTDGNLYKNRWLAYGGKYYYLTGTGAAASGTNTIQGRTFKFGSSCELLGSVPSYVAAAARSGGSIATNSSSSSQNATKESNSASADKPSGTTASNTASQASPTTGNAGTSASSSSSMVNTSADKTTTAAITEVVGKLNEIPKSRRNFVINIAKYVRKYAPKYGIKVYSPIIAQAIHESGWGESSLSAKYHNYFGLKCGTLWTGKSVNLSTKEEYSAGTLTTIRSNFRVYDNMEQGVKGYFEFIQLARYANLKGVTNPRQYLTNIKNDGYATGSLYVDHTMALINLYNLTQFDK